VNARGPFGAVGCAGLVALAAGAVLAACTPASSPDSPAVATLQQQQCGKCHAPPAPRMRTRVQLEDALARHRSRVHLRDDQWSAILLYLSVPEGTAARQGD
jgi:hypothetical protein